MLTADVVVRPVDRPLELGEESLGGVRPDPHRADVLADRVVNGDVRGHALRHRAVGLVPVGVERSALHVDLFLDRWQQGYGSYVRDDTRADLAGFEVHQAHDDGLVRDAGVRALVRVTVLAWPPIHVSSAMTVPDKRPATGSRFIASRMRCSMCQADSFVTLYLRLISHAETLFFAEQTSKMTKSHVRILIFVPWKIVSVRTENCFLQPRQRHTHR